MNTALVVEDDPRIASLCGRLLSGMGLSPILAGTGREALKLLAETDSPLAFVYVDLGLPDVPGLEVADAARRLRPDLAILIATGAIEALDTHGHRVLHKPFTLVDFKHAVAELRGAARTVPPA
jgi:DNA-binding response OmpR family regulator